MSKQRHFNTRLSNSKQSFTKRLQYTLLFVPCWIHNLKNVVRITKS